MNEASSNPAQVLPHKSYNHTNLRATTPQAASQHHHLSIRPRTGWNLHHYTPETSTQVLVRPNLCLFSLPGRGKNQAVQIRFILSSYFFIAITSVQTLPAPYHAADSSVSFAGRSILDFGLQLVPAVQWEEGLETGEAKTSFWKPFHAILWTGCDFDRILKNALDHQVSKVTPVQSHFQGWMHFSGKFSKSAGLKSNYMNIEMKLIHHYRAHHTVRGQFMPVKLIPGHGDLKTHVWLLQSIPF